MLVARRLQTAVAGNRFLQLPSLAGMIESSPVLVVSIFFHFQDTSRTCIVTCTAVDSQQAKK